MTRCATAANAVDLMDSKNAESKPALRIDQFAVLLQILRRHVLNLRPMALCLDDIGGDRFAPAFVHG